MDTETPSLPSTSSAAADRLFAVLQDRAEIEHAVRRIASGKATIEDYAVRSRTWKERASLFSACQMIRHGFASPEDFRDKANAWIQSASPCLAAKMIRHHIATPDDFSERVHVWSRHPQYAFWREGLKAIPGASPVSQPGEWIADASFASAMKLVEDGLAFPADFSSRVSSWVDFGPKDRLDTLSELGFLPEDEAEATRDVRRDVFTACYDGRHVSEQLKDACLQFGDGASVHRLLSSGVVSREECADRIDEWLAEASVDTAPYLVKYGFASAEEMRAKLLDRLPTLSVNEVHPLFRAGIVTADDFATMGEGWLSTLTSDTLNMAFDMGLIDGENALYYFLLWGDEKLMEHTRFAHLVRSRIAVESLVGRKVVGRFKKHESGGAVVRVNGIDGFVMQSDIGWYKAETGGCDFQWGDTVECIVVRFSQRDLLLRLVHPDGEKFVPVGSQYPAGKVVEGRVTSVKPYGIFVEFAPGLTGFVFRGEVGWGKDKGDMEDSFSVGDTVSAVVMKVDEEARRITLSIKRLTKDPWERAKGLLRPCMRVTGTVTRVIGRNAILVEVAPGVVGIVPKVEMSWHDRDSKIPLGYSVGDKVDVMVKSYDAKRHRAELSIKATLPNPWIVAEREYPVGSIVKGVVRNISMAVAFVEMPSGVTAILPRSEIGGPETNEMPYEVGDGVEARVLYVSAQRSSLILSVRAVTASEDEFNSLSEHARQKVEGGQRDRASA